MEYYIKTDNKGRPHLALQGLLLAIALILYTLESMFEWVMPVPGAKLGLANMVSLYTLMTLGFEVSLKILLLRVLLASIFLGKIFSVSFYISLGAGVVSLCIMALVKKYFSGKISAIGISLLGATSHNIMQLLIASVVLETRYIFNFLPILVLVSLPTGFFNGIIVEILTKQRNILGRK